MSGIFGWMVLMAWLFGTGEKVMPQQAPEVCTDDITRFSPLQQQQHLEHDLKCNHRNRKYWIRNGKFNRAFNYLQLRLNDHCSRMKVCVWNYGYTVYPKRTEKMNGMSFKVELYFPEAIWVLISCIFDIFSIDFAFLGVSGTF